MMNRFAWVEAKNVQEAARLAGTTAAQLAIEGKSVAKAASAVIKAGGIDLLDLMKEGLIEPSRLINIRFVPGLKSVSYESGKGMTIGPLVTLAQIAAHKDIIAGYRALAQAAAQIASPNIRNVATIGGNLLQRPHCWYFRSADFLCLRKGGGRCFACEGENKYHAIFDNVPCAIVHPSTMAVALVALGATVKILSADGKTRNVKLENFFVGPLKDFRRENLLSAREIITAIHLPESKCSSVYVKIQEKDSLDWPVVDCSVALAMAGGICRQASVIVGAVAPVPWRAKEAEAVITGKVVNDSLAAQAAEQAFRAARPLAQNAYKIKLGSAVVRKAILAAAQIKT